VAVAIALDVPERAELGSELEVGVSVSSARARSIDRIEVSFVGHASFHLDDAAPARKLFERSHTIEGPLDVGPEPRRFVKRFSLPDDLPASHPGTTFTVSYGAAAQVEVPWWFDAHAHADVRVGAQAEPRPERTPARAASPNDPAHLFAELSVDDVAAAPGEVVTGAFALGNVGDRRLDGATVSLVGTLSVADVTNSENVETVFKSITHARDGSVVDFSLKVPDWIAPGTDSASANLGWELVLRVDGSRTQVRLPIRVGPYGESRQVEDDGAAPVVGAGRWRDGWAREARDGLALHPKKLRLEGTLAPGVEAVIEPRASWLGADLRWEGFGIELEISPRHLFNRGNIDFAANEARFSRLAISGRCHEQVVDAISPSFTRALAPFTEIEIGDAEAKLGMNGAAHDQAAVAAFVVALRTLGSEIVSANRRICAPPAAGGCDAEWTRFARDSSGRLRLGRLAILGAHVDGDEVDIETRFEGALPSRTRVTLRLDPPVTVEAKRGAEGSAALAALAEAARKVVTVLAEASPRGEPNITVARRRIVVEIAGYLANPVEVRKVVSPMLVLARQLRGEREGGPYR
jgi:hypothetical protein